MCYDIIRLGNRVVSQGIAGPLWACGVETTRVGSIRNVLIFISPDRPYRLALLSGVLRFAREAGNWSLSLDPFGSLGPEQLAHDQWTGDGIIGIIWNAPQVKALLKKGVPAVNLAGSPKEIALPRVVPDNFRIGQLAGRYFLDRGFRRFACFSVRKTWSSQLRRDGFVEVLRAAGMDGDLQEMRFHLRPDHYQETDVWHEDQRLIEKWVASLGLSVAVLASNDMWSRRIALAARTQGIAIPEDLSLLGVENEEVICEFSDPPLSSIDAALEEVGYRGAQLLAELMDGGQGPDEPVLVAPNGVVARRSTDILAVDDPVLAAAMRFIQKNASAPIRIVDVVESAGVSRRMLERRFRKHLGRGLNDEINRVHIERAKQLLAETTMNIAEVARASGMIRRRQLSRVFAELAGSTPTAFRRQLRAWRI